MLTFAVTPFTVGSYTWERHLYPFPYSLAQVWLVPSKMKLVDAIVAEPKEVGTPCLLHPVPEDVLQQGDDVFSVIHCQLSVRARWISVVSPHEFTFDAFAVNHIFP